MKVMAMMMMMMVLSLKAFIAESLGDDDTMDLFRHTTELCDNVSIFLSM